jgi:hypothetical protein
MPPEKAGRLTGFLKTGTNWILNNGCSGDVWRPQSFSAGQLTSTDHDRPTLTSG